MTAGFFGHELGVVNVGLADFAAAIGQHGARVVTLDWAPPAGGDAALGRALARMIDHPAVEAANARAFARYLAAEPRITGVAPAGRAIEGMGARSILHAGPPIAWADMCGPMQGAVIGAAIYEGWADDAAKAEAMAAGGGIDFAPCHHHGAVGPMAGIISPSMPVWIIENGDRGNRAFSTLNEGLGKVLRYGANNDEVIARLRWIAGVLAPVMGRAVEALGGIEARPIIAQALHMGDEMHNRNVAATALLLKRLAPAMVECDAPHGDIAAAMRFIAGNDLFFLNIAMASCKAMVDAARGVADSTMVTAMARNGVEFGLRLSGCGDRWFTAPAPMIDGLYFPGFGADDANPDLGDSTITETAGLGGFAMAAAPAIVQFVGGTQAVATGNTRRMSHITLGVNGAFTLATMNFQPTPAGIDVRKVVDTGICPAINTGIAHRRPGIGQIGAGLTQAPLGCFIDAVAALAAGIDP
jgi:Protein of unknown function (DUF1116)